MTSAELVDIKSAELQDALLDAGQVHEVFEEHRKELHDGFPTIAQSLIVEEDRIATIGVFEARKALEEARAKANQEQQQYTSIAA